MHSPRESDERSNVCGNFYWGTMGGCEWWLVCILRSMTKTGHQLLRKNAHCCRSAPVSLRRSNFSEGKDKE